MPRGPLPTGEAARRNAPTIPTTKLPKAGRIDPAPVCPLPLCEAGARWWEWAWHTPQAAAWSDGDLYFVAHRAELEDDERTERRTKSMTDMDDRLGLTPKGMAQLRWKIVDDEKPAATKNTTRRNLQAV